MLIYCEYWDQPSHDQKDYMCVCVCARTGLYFNVPQCSAPRPRVWQKQMLNWAPAAGLRTKLPSHKAISPSRQWLCRPVQRFYLVFTPFVHHKSSADARRGRKKKKKTGKCQRPNWDKKFYLHCCSSGISKRLFYLFIYFSPSSLDTDVIASWMGCQHI